MIIGSGIEKHAILSSTNSKAYELIKSAKPSEGYIIRAEYQSSGRGQGSNAWESEHGMNLLFSVILYPDMIRPREQFLLSMVVSLAIADIIGATIEGVSIKWPNDIYVKDDKIAGILIENGLTGESIDYTIAGVGINLNQIVFPASLPNPTSLALITHTEVNTSDWLDRILKAMDIRYKELIQGNFDQIRRDYNNSLYRLNINSAFRDKEGFFRGIIKGVDEAGLLKIISDEGREKSFLFKEVEFVRLSPPSQ